MRLSGGHYDILGIEGLRLSLATCGTISGIHLDIAAEGMPYRETLSACTGCRQSLWFPAIPETNGILKSLFVKVETVLFQWEGI